MGKIPRIYLLILFGSRARGTAGAQSDTDIAVLSDHELSFEEKGAVGTYAAEKVGVSEDAIDVIDVWVAPPLLQHAIAEEGKLLEGNSQAFLRFRVLAWKRYQNTARFRRMRKKHLEKIYG